MTDPINTKPEEVDPPDPDASDPSTGTQKPEPGDQQRDPVPYGRFNTVITERNQLREEMARYEEERAEREKVEKEAAEQRLSEQQQFEQLAEQRKAERDDAAAERDRLKDQTARQTAVLESLYEARKAAVPEMYRPLLEKLDLVERLSWIADNEDKLGRRSPDGIPQTPDPQGNGKLTDEERRRQAARTF